MRRVFTALVGPDADLWWFDSNRKPAMCESRNGLGNEVNYGFRTMLTAPDGMTLWVGTANLFNVDPKGGWELIELWPNW